MGTYYSQCVLHFSCTVHPGRAKLGFIPMQLPERGGFMHRYLTCIPMRDLGVLNMGVRVL